MSRALPGKVVEPIVTLDDIEKWIDSKVSEDRFLLLRMIRESAELREKSAKKFGSKIVKSSVLLRQYKDVDYDIEFGLDETDPFIRAVLVANHDKLDELCNEYMKGPKDTKGPNVEYEGVPLLHWAIDRYYNTHDKDVLQCIETLVACTECILTTDTLVALERIAKREEDCWNTIEYALYTKRKILFPKKKSLFH